jgi:mRNA interferase RelE/StbE
VNSSNRHTVTYAPKAAKELSRIEKALASRIADAVDRLASEPFPAGCRKLTGYDALWRIRIQDYRVVYTVDDGELLVIALRVAHRRAVYRNL